MRGTFLYNYLLGNHFMNFKGHDIFYGDCRVTLGILPETTVAMVDVFQDVR